MSKLIENERKNEFSNYLKLATSALKCGDWEKAEKNYILAIKINSNDPVLYNNIGIVYYKKKDFDKALEMFNYAAFLDPIYFDANYNLANLYFVQKDIQKAIYYATCCVNTFPDKKKGHHLLEKVSAGQSVDHIFKYREAPAKPLKILFVQESPCIRNYKTAVALKSRGHSVSLVYTKAKLSQMYNGLSDDIYDNLFLIKRYRELWDIAEDFDVVHCHNEPDLLSVNAFACNTPVIHDTHDLISLRAPENENLKFFEGVANRGAQGRVYTTPYQMVEAFKLYGVKGPSIVLYNYTSEQDLVKEKLKKLSDTDHQFHFVYEGGIGYNPHRNFIELFLQLGRIDNVQLHIYPAFIDEKIKQIFSASSNIHLYGPVSPQNIIQEMSKYDAGIIPFNLDQGNKPFLNTTIANKLYEYLAAGLPVITSRLESYTRFFKENSVGFIYDTADDIKKFIPHLKELSKTINFDDYIFTYEDEIYRLEWLYNKVIKQYPKQNDITGGTKHKPKFPEIKQAIMGEPDGGNNDNFCIEIPVDKLEIPPVDLDQINISLSKIIVSHYKWLKLNGFSGYDHYDIHSALYEKGKQNGDNVINLLKNADPIKEMTSLKYRKELGISKVIYPESFGMYIQAFTMLPKDIQNLNIESSINYLVESLEQKVSGHLFETGWGYPYNRNMGSTNIIAGFPDAINTYFVGNAYLSLFHHYEKDVYLENAVKVAAFFSEYLYLKSPKSDNLCFSLTPDKEQITNTSNLLVAVYLATLGNITDNEKWIEQAHIAFTTSMDKLDSRAMLLKYIDYDLDNCQVETNLLDHIYHLYALYHFRTQTDDKRVHRVFENYMDSFIENFFNSNNIPVEPCQDCYTIDSYSMGLLLQILSTMLLENDLYFDKFFNMLSMIFSHFFNESGSFVSHVDFHPEKLRINNFPYFIRNQASMLNGLVHFFDYWIKNSKTLEENAQKMNLQMAI